MPIPATVARTSLIKRGIDGMTAGGGATACVLCGEQAQRDIGSRDRNRDIFTEFVNDLHGRFNQAAGSGASRAFDLKPRRGS